MCYAASALALKVIGSSVLLVVVVRGKDFSANMRAVNGIAKTFTNVTPLGKMPRAAPFASTACSPAGR